MRTVRRVVWAVAMLLASGAAAAAQSTTPEPPAVATPLEVQGFRSAHWGMNAAEIKAAIKKDFNIPADRVLTEENPSERTIVVSVTVPDLIEGAGKARVSYVLGYTTKKLVQVSIIWGTPVDPQTKPDEIVAAANQLHELFLTSGYQPGTIRSNVATGNGSIVVFEGQDADKHTTLLTLVNGAVPATTRNGKREPPVQTVALQLSYRLDAQNPDIFRLKKGQF